MEFLCLTGVVRRDVIAHAEGVAPAEAVGLLGGRDGLATAAFPLPNLGGFRTFLAEPYAQYQAEKAMRLAGLRPLAVYHSHPGGGVHLSALDIAFASNSGLIQVVIAFGRACRSGVEIRAFRVLAGEASEVTLAEQS